MGSRDGIRDQRIGQNRRGSNYIRGLGVILGAMAAKPLAQKSALVTGASAGIGRETAKVLAQSGADVTLTARRKDRLDAIASEIRSASDSEVLVVPTDVTEPREVADAVAETADEFDGLDIVVSNAGMNRFGTVEDIEIEKYHEVMAVNCDGSFFVARESIPYLRDTSGALVFVASFAGKHPRPGQPLYAASKWWVRGFALSLAGAIGPDDVAVSVINPTEVMTEIGIQDGRPAHDRFDPEQSAEPEEVAAAIAFMVEQEPPNAITELDFFRRDKFGSFHRD